MSTEGLFGKIIELAERSITCQRDLIQLNQLLQQLAVQVQALEARIVVLEGK